MSFRVITRNDVILADVLTALNKIPHYRSG